MDEIMSLPESAEQQVRAPQGWGPIRYLREATRIARFDAEAIARMSRDKWALLYGAGVVAVGILALLTSSVSSLSPAIQETWSTLNPGSQDVPAVFVVVFTGFTLAFWVVFQLLLSVVGVAVLHGAAKLVFGATGTYVGLLRVLWLGSIVNWLAVIPFVGRIAAVIWVFLIQLVTFEEVDGIERLQALALAAIYSAVLVALAIFFI